MSRTSSSLPTGGRPTSQLARESSRPRGGRLLPSLVLALAGAACGGTADDATTAPPSAPAVQRITIAPTSPSIEVGRAVQLAATVAADAGASRALTWIARDPRVATVSGTGLVTGVGRGSTRIVAISDATPTIADSIPVTVRGIAGIAVTPAAASVDQGQSVQLTAAVTADSGVSPAVTWTVDPAGVATVSASGMVSAVAPGIARVVASSAVAPSVTGTAVVTVRAAPPLTNTLSVVIQGLGTGTVTATSGDFSCGSGTCTASLANTNTLTLAARAAPGSTFAGWGGACTGAGECVVRMDQPRTVVATFTPQPPATTALFVAPEIVYLYPGETASFRAIDSTKAAGVRERYPVAAWSATGGGFESASGNGAQYTAPRTPGDYTVTARATAAPGMSATARVVVLPLGNDPGIYLGGITTNSMIVVGAGGWHISPVGIALQRAPTTTTTVTVRSSDPARVLLTRNPSVVGTGTISFQFTPLNQYDQFYVQALDGAGGTVTLIASGPVYSDGATAVVVRPVSVQLDPLPEALTTISTDSRVMAQVGFDYPDLNGNWHLSPIRPGGRPITVTVTNSNASVAQLLTPSGPVQRVQLVIPAFAFASSFAWLHTVGAGTTSVGIAETQPALPVVPPATHTIVVTRP